MSYKLVIFDWDGTLADSHDYIIGAMQDAAISYSLPVRSRGQIASIIGLSMKEAILGLYPELNTTEVEGFRLAYAESFNDQNKPQPRLFPDAPYILEHLRERDIQMAVATGKKMAGLERGLNHTKTRQYFDHLCTADTSESKPHPQMILTIIEKLSVSPDEVLMVGDSIIDLQMANAAKVASYGVTTGSSTREELSEYSPIGITDNIKSLEDFV